MGLVFWTVTTTIKGVTRVLCRVDDRALAKVPASGPLILVCNHINFLDVPMTYTHLQPRPLTGLVKSESWENPWLGRLFDLWGGIPLRRGQADVGALHEGLKALEAGKIVAVTPEGTRSGHGRLQPAHPGLVSLAVHSGAPLLPLAYYGGEGLQDNLRRFKRTGFHFRVGEPFYLDAHGKLLNRELRRSITDEIMYQLARLLPQEYRGVYSDLERATTHYLKFDLQHGSSSIPPGRISAAPA